MNPIESRIVKKLNEAFQPLLLQIVNESHMHSVPPGSESHFKVTLVTEHFAGKRQVARHQMVYHCLSEELQGPVHALALHTFSPEEWAAAPVVAQSPNCMGGSKHDQNKR